MRQTVIDDMESIDEEVLDYSVVVCVAGMQVFKRWRDIQCHV